MSVAEATRCRCGIGRKVVRGAQTCGHCDRVCVLKNCPSCKRIGVKL